jgi:hypothetical protein
MPNDRRPNARALALKMHIEKLSPNLIRASVLDMIQDAPPEEIEKLIVAFQAQNTVRGVAG